MMRTVSSPCTHIERILCHLSLAVFLSRTTSSLCNTVNGGVGSCLRLVARDVAHRVQSAAVLASNFTFSKLLTLETGLLLAAPATGASELAISHYLVAI